MKLDELLLKKILIIRTSSLGDIIHALPFLSSLKKSFPSIRFWWLIKDSFSGILSGNPYLEGIISMERGNYFEIFKELKRENFDASFDLQGLLRTSVIPFLLKIPHRWGKGNSKENVSFFYNEVFSPSSSHIVDQYLDLAEFLGAERFFEFPFSEEERWKEKATHYFSSKGKRIVIVPGGGWENKRLPEGKYSQLIKILSKKGYDIFIFWGKGERDLAKRIRENSSNDVKIFPFLDIKGMISFFKRVNLVIGGDTGPLHLASSLGVPVIGIYGPTDPKRNGPYGKNSRVIFHSLPCSPCWRRKCKKNLECLRSIKVEEIVNKVEEMT